jgi:ABC-type multidrug transport system ATPase subunit
VLTILEIQHVRDCVVGDVADWNSYLGSGNGGGNSSRSTKGISSGQRKRLNIGMELVAYPRILFLDEPTTGLDAAAATKVIHCLNKMKKLGITIIAVLNEPVDSAFRLFSDCLLLAPGGKTSYLGQTDGVLEYFMRLGYRKG